MSGGFDKFAWISAIRADEDERLSVGIKYVLQNIALVYVRHNGVGDLYARQETIAEKLKVSPGQVKKAYKVANARGYFVLQEARQRGRGHHGADRYRLQVPEEIGANCAPNTDEIGARIDGNRCTDRPKYVHELTEIGARIDGNMGSNQQKEALQGIKKGIKQGGEGGTAVPDEPPNLPAVPQQSNVSPSNDFPPSNNDAAIAAADDEDIYGPIVEAELVLDEPHQDDPEPKRFCSEHAANPGRACRTCQYLGDQHDAWKRRQAAKELSAIFAALPERQPEPPPPRWRCSDCHDLGVVLNSDGKPGSDPRKCHHDRSWHQMTDGELAEYASLLEQLNEGVA